MSCKRISRVRGAVTGTIVGAVIGALSTWVSGNDRRTAAIRGGIVGAAAGVAPRWTVCSSKLPRPHLLGRSRRRRHHR